MYIYVLYITMLNLMIICHFWFPIGTQILLVISNLFFQQGLNENLCKIKLMGASAVACVYV